MPFGHVLDAPALRASGFAPCSPYGGPVFRVCALRFAPCARHSSRFAASGFAPILNSAWSSHCAHKLACGTPCFIGLTSACFAHSARPSCAPALTLARCSAPADSASLRVLGAPAASRPPTLASSLVALPASLGSSYRPALRWPGILGLRSASRCPRPFTPSGLRQLRPVSRTARGLRALPQFSMVVPHLRTALR